MISVLLLAAVGLANPIGGDPQSGGSAAATNEQAAAHSETASGEAASETQSRDDGDKMVCKLASQTMSRFKKKTCHTRRQWDRMAEESRRAYGEQRDRPVIDITRGD